MERSKVRTAICFFAGMMLCATSSSAFDAHFNSAAEEDLTQSLRAASSILEAHREAVEDPSEIIAAVQSDYRNLITVLYQAGYYGPDISIKVDGREAASMSLISLPSLISNVTIDVQPGPRFTFGKAQVSPLADDTVLPDAFRSGAHAKSDVIAEASSTAIEAWRQASHAKAAIETQEIVADHHQNKLDVALGIDPGPEVRFGTLQFSGSTSVTPRRLKLIANLHMGERYDPDTLDLVMKRLQKTGTFRSITLREADTLTADNQLDIIATVVDEKPRRFGFGAEFSSIEGGTVSAYWMHRNLTDNADRLRFDAEISGLGGTTGTDYSLATTYRRPATVTRKTTLVLGAEIAHLDEPDYISDSGEFTLGFDVETAPDSTFSVGMGYRYSRVEDALSRSASLDNREFTQIIFPIEGTKDTRDDRLSPSRGTYFEAEILPFVGVSGSSSGTRVFADGRAYRSLGSENRLTFAARLQLGTIFGASYTEVPPDMLFFSGGGGTVRGQPYQSLDVDLGSGDATGGSSFFGASAELRAKIKSKISLVGFYDLGGIGTTALPGENAVWHAGAGLGLRYDTGVGPIRLDLAAPVSGDTGDGLQIYIGIGQAF